MALTKYNYNSFDLTTAASKGLAFNSNANGFETSSAGSMPLIKTLTASSSSNLTFAHGTSDVVLDNTYPIYLFKCINMHPANDDVFFAVNFRDGSTAYDATKTTTFFTCHHGEADSATGVAYNTGFDVVQSTSGQDVFEDNGNDNDQCGCAILQLFEPSSTTFVKHFLIRSRNMSHADYTADGFAAGYINTTTAIDGVQFKFASGNIDAGTIKMYGVL